MLMIGMLFSVKRQNLDANKKFSTDVLREYTLSENASSLFEIYEKNSINRFGRVSLEDFIEIIFNNKIMKNSQNQQMILKNIRFLDNKINDNEITKELKEKLAEFMH